MDGVTIGEYKRRMRFNISCSDGHLAHAGGHEGGIIAPGGFRCQRKCGQNRRIVRLCWTNRERFGHI